MLIIICSSSGVQMSTPSKKRQREREREHVSLPLQLYSNCEKEFSAQIQSTLSCFPPELCKLVGESLTLPYRYTWEHRPGLFHVRNSGRTVEFDQNQLVASIASPAFRNPHAVDDGKYVADWVVGRGQVKMLPRVRFWAGICNPESMNGDDLECGNYVGVRISRDKLLDEIVVASSLCGNSIRVSVAEFETHGLRFSVDFRKGDLCYCVGSARRLISFANIPSDWKHCAPFISVAVSTDRPFFAHIETLPVSSI